MTRTVTTLFLATALAAGALQAASLRFKPGLWEVTTSTQVPEPHSHTVKRCYTPEEVKVANGTAAEVTAAIKANEATRKLESTGCKVQEIQLNGSTIREFVLCPTYTYEDVTTYHDGDRFESDTTLTPQKGPVRKLHNQAHRVGDCPKK